MNLSRLFRSGLFVVLTTFVSAGSESAFALLQHGEGDGEMEVFEEVDPYTKGKPELMKKLGYERFGPFQWTKGFTTNELEETLGGTPLIWVETEHFKIGSSLTTYQRKPDVEEKALFNAELKRLKKRIGRLKVPRGELDPWLRLHLYAQRAEETYAAFMKDFKLAPTDFEEGKPYLGNPNKFLILLCERKSELSRYTRAVHERNEDSMFRTAQFNDCMVVAGSLEAVRENYRGRDDEPVDSVFHCQIIFSLTTSFVDGFQGRLYEAPDWLGNVLGHLYVRRIDRRFLTSRGYGANDPPAPDSWKWIDGVQKLVKNKFFATTEEMFGWLKYEDMDKRDHMIAWSKLDYLIEELDGDHKTWLEAMTTQTKGAEEKEEHLERQTRALLACFELTPAELDKKWAKWVKKTYKNRK